MRLRHLYVPLLALWAVATVVSVCAGVAAAVLGWPIAALPLAFAATLAAAAIWLHHIPPHGPAARAAYQNLENAIHTAPPGPLHTDNHYLNPRPSRALPELDRWHHTHDAVVVGETYTLLWAPPLVLRHTTATYTHTPPEPMNTRDTARFLWHTLRTGQGFADTDEMHALADELRAAKPLHD